MTPTTTPDLTPITERIQNLPTATDWRIELRDIADELVALTATDSLEWGVILTRSAKESDPPAAWNLGYVILPGAARAVTYRRALELAAITTSDPRSTVSYSARVVTHDEMTAAVAGFRESGR